MNWILYVYVSLIVMMFGLVYMIIRDREILTIELLIEDITNATIISIAWAINIPILVISNIVISILYIIYDRKNGDDE